MSEDELVAKVTLLGIYKKEPQESLEDVMNILIETGMYDLKEAKEVFENLKKESYIVNEALSMKGLIEAKNAEEIFKQK